MFNNGNQEKTLPWVDEEYVHLPDGAGYSLRVEMLFGFRDEWTRSHVGSHFNHLYAHKSYDLRCSIGRDIRNGMDRERRKSKEYSQYLG